METFESSFVRCSRQRASKQETPEAQKKHNTGWRTNRDASQEIPDLHRDDIARNVPIASRVKQWAAQVVAAPATGASTHPELVAEDLHLALGNRRKVQ
jgi:hypothetical protein